MTITQRADFSTIASWVAPNARVLDLGCGDGSLLAYLREKRQASGYGIENFLGWVRPDPIRSVVKLWHDGGIEWEFSRKRQIGPGL